MLANLLLKTAKKISVIPTLQTQSFLNTQKPTPGPVPQAAPGIVSQLLLKACLKRIQFHIGAHYSSMNSLLNHNTAKPVKINLTPGLFLAVIPLGKTLVELLHKTGNVQKGLPPVRARAGKNNPGRVKPKSTALGLSLTQRSRAGNVNQKVNVVVHDGEGDNLYGKNRS